MVAFLPARGVEMALLRGSSKFPEIRGVRYTMLIAFIAGVVLAAGLTAFDGDASEKESPLPLGAKDGMEERKRLREMSRPLTTPPALPETFDPAEHAELLEVAVVSTKKGGDSNPSSADASQAGSAEGSDPIRSAPMNLTLNLVFQERVEKFLAEVDPMEAAFVAIDPKTGRVLAMVGYRDGKLQPVAALEAKGPAASIFKVITAAALLEKGKVSGDTTVCTPKPKKNSEALFLTPNPDRDRHCETLVEAMGHSNNPILARLADKHLSQRDLGETAERFMFNKHIPFIWPVEVSKASVPQESNERASMAAGFRNATLSPLHGALIAAAIANKGVMMSPRIAEEIPGKDGQMVTIPAAVLGEAFKPEIAEVLGHMMEATTSFGTAAKFFTAKQESPLWGIKVAGKTGSLTLKDGSAQPPHYSWFIGYAPADEPEIAIAAMTVNPPAWKLKSGTLARFGLEAFFRHVSKGGIESVVTSGARADQ